MSLNLKPQCMQKDHHRSLTPHTHKMMGVRVNESKYYHKMNLYKMCSNRMEWGSQIHSKKYEENISCTY